MYQEFFCDGVGSWVFVACGIGSVMMPPKGTSIRDLLLMSMKSFCRWISRALGIEWGFASFDDVFQLSSGNN